MKTSTAKNKQNYFLKSSGFLGGSARPWTQQHPKAGCWGPWGSPGPSRAGLQLSEDPSNAHLTASGPGATDRWESQTARKSVLRHGGVGLQGAGWVVSTFKRYLCRCPGRMPPGCPTLSVEDTEQRPGRPGGEQRARGPSAHPELAGSSPPVESPG